MNYYETGGVPPRPRCQKDVQNICRECGKVWVGTLRFLCTDCNLARLQEAELLAKAARLDALRELCGHIEDGSSEVITIGQDDATGSWCLTKGFTSSIRRSKNYYGGSFDEVIDKAIKGA